MQVEIEVFENFFQKRRFNDKIHLLERCFLLPV